MSAKILHLRRPKDDPDSSEETLDPSPGTNRAAGSEPAEAAAIAAESVAARAGSGGKSKAASAAGKPGNLRQAALRQAALRKRRRWSTMPSPVEVLARIMELPGMRVPGTPRMKIDPVHIIARALDSQERLQAELWASIGHGPKAPAEKAEPPAKAPIGTPQFWQLWLAHRDYLYRYSLRFSNGNRADAEDSVQDAMLKAAAAFSDSEVRNHRAWFLRLVHNSCMDRHRGYQRQTRMAKDAAHEDDCPYPAIVPQRELSPEDMCSVAEFADELKQMLAALPESLAEPLLQHLDGRPDAEIASNLKVTQEVIRKRRQMAREWLRRQLMG